ncbi:MAG: hypothetical protein SPL51_04880 [Lachnospiraceae bacterium]|nr:hypothetical protein [Lachnospiraceae bacterium]
MEKFIQSIGAGIVIIVILAIMIFILWIRSMIANVNTDINTDKLNKQIANLQDTIFSQNMMIQDMRNQLNFIINSLNNNDK